MDKLLSLTLPLSDDQNEEYFQELLKLVENKYNVTLKQILESRNQIEISDNVYYALDMLLVDPMKWLNLNGVRLDPKLDINFVNELRDNTCQYKKKCYDTEDAVKNNHFECLKYTYQQNGNSWNKNTFATAATKGNLKILKYLYENGAPWDRWICAYAAMSGQLDCLKYLHENGCPWDTYACKRAAEYGHLDMLKYLHENGCPWDEDTCKNAAYSKHLDCLKYAHENGCPWNEDTCDCAATGNKKLKCLKYAIENGCPFDKNRCIYHASMLFANKCVEYLKSL